jgi:hypothetical protein
VNSPSRSVRWIPGVVLVLLMAGCRSDSSDITPPPQEGPPLTSGSVVVNRSAVLLTGIGQSRQLTARTTDVSGAAVNAAVVWSSSAPDQVSVDATGRVVAKTIGSAQVFAQSGGVRSAPVFVVVAEPHPGALIVNDAQVLAIGQPIGLAPGEFPGVGTRYEVRLTGISTPPAAGTVILGAEDAPVAGKVVSARNESGAMVVTLAMAPLSELLARYSIDWSIDLSDFPAVVAPTGAGSAAANLSQAVLKHPHSTGPAANIIQPFTALNCDASLGPVLLDRRVQLAPTVDLRLDFVESPGHTRRAVVGSYKLVGTIAVKLNAGFKVTGNCLAQVLFRIPIGGPLALGIMPGVRVGVGVALEGQLAVTAGELSVTGEYGTSIELGWECGGAAASCQSLDKVTPINTLTPKMEVFNPVTGMRVELQGQFYALVGLDAVFFTAWTAGVLEARAGPVQSVDLGFEEDQADNPGYASKYDLKLEAVVEPGSGLQALLDFVGNGIRLTFQAKVSTVLSESPKGNLTVSRPVVGLSGGTVDITVDLTNTDYFLIGYNVVRVELWQRRATDETFTRLRTFNATQSNQSRFTHTWQPTPDDLGTNEFAAFVYTQFPVPGLEVADNSIRQVDVKCFSTSPRVGAAVAAAANTCADTWVGTATFFAPGQIRIDASVTWRRDSTEAEIDGDIFYVATGIATVKWLYWDAQGCSVSQNVFPIAGDDVRDSNDLLVEYGESPQLYSGGSEILLLVTVSCPGEVPFDYPLVGSWFAGAGEVSPDGTVIQGRLDAGSGVYWEWRFARP